MVTCDDGFERELKFPTSNGDSEPSKHLRRDLIAAAQEVGLSPHDLLTAVRVVSFCWYDNLRKVLRRTDWAT